MRADTVATIRTGVWTGEKVNVRNKTGGKIVRSKSGHISGSDVRMRRK